MTEAREPNGRPQRPRKGSGKGGARPGSGRKPGTGAPYKPGQQRARWVHLRVTDAERAELESAARRSGNSIADYVRLRLGFTPESTP